MELGNFKRTSETICQKFCETHCKMGKSFENLDNILLDWAKDKVQKHLVSIDFYIVERELSIYYVSAVLLIVHDWALTGNTRINL